MQEGLARWVDTTLFASDPIFISRDTFMEYFLTSQTALFDRSYDAVGFWGHLQDVSGDLWHRIPAILTAAVNGRDAALHAALAGVNSDQFFDTWGSSAFNDAAGGDAWTARSPLPDAGFAAPARTISATTSVSLDPDSTDQLQISIPAAPSGDIETVHIDVGLAYGRFGLQNNYTGSELEKLTFCGGPSGCSAPMTPTGGGCGAGETYVPPPELTPLPSDPLLGLAAAQSPAVVSIDFVAVPLTTATSGTCTPATSPSEPGTGTGTAPVAVPLSARPEHALFPGARLPAQAADARRAAASAPGSGREPVPGGRDYQDGAAGRVRARRGRHRPARVRDR